MLVHLFWILVYYTDVSPTTEEKKNKKGLVFVL